MAFNCASTSIGTSAFWFSTSMVTVHYQHWDSLIVPVLVLAFLHLGPVPVLAHTITGTGIQKWCSYWYWHCCTLVHYRYGHSPLLVLVFNFARTGIGISALRFSTGTGTVHYPHWHSKLVPIPVLAFLHFGSVPVWAHSATRTGIHQWFQYRYWNFCTLVHYQYWCGSLLVGPRGTPTTCNQHGALRSNSFGQIWADCEQVFVLIPMWFLHVLAFWAQCHRAPVIYPT